VGWIDIDGNVVVRLGNKQDDGTFGVTGVDVTSQGGYLITDAEADPFPFQFILANRRHQMTVANLGFSSIISDSDLLLPTQYDLAQR